MPSSLTFAHLLRQQRAQLGFTQTQLADAVGCSVSLIRKYESGARPPTTAITARLAQAFGLEGIERRTFLALARQPVALPGTATDLRLPNNLGWIPAPPTALLGRERQLAQLVESLKHVPGRLISLIGPPGVGKSRLAIAGAEALRDQFAAGVWFVELASINDPTALAGLIARRLQIPVGTEPEQDLIKYLQQRTLLLVLDNYEHLISAAAFVARILAAAPTLRILVTSRIPLRIRAEICIEIEPLPLPRSNRIAIVAAAPATRLFCDRATAISPSFRLNTTNAASVATICAMLDGLPLAIELAAARSDQFTPEAIVRQLTQGLLRFSGDLADLPPHQKTLQATISWSEQLLPEGARQSFTLLGVFIGSFDDHAAAAIGIEQLATLREHGLVQQHENQRYRMLETLRAYAAEQLAASSHAAAVYLRHAHYFTELAEQQAVLLEGTAATHAALRIDADFPNIRAALVWSLTHDGGVIAARLTIALRRYWLSRGLVHDGRLIEQLLTSEHMHAIPESLLGRTLLTVGYLGSQQGSLQALALLERGLHIAKQHGTPADIAWGLILCVLPARYPGNLAFCTTLLQQAIAINRARDDQQQLAYTLNQLGVASCENRHYKAAIPYLEEAVQIAERVGNMVLIQGYRGDLGEALYFLGDLRRAQQIFADILDHTAQTNDLSAAWATQVRCARIAIEEGQLTTAEQLLNQASQAVQQMNIHYGMTMVLRQQGYLALAYGNQADALALLESGCQRGISSFFIEELAACLIGLARLSHIHKPMQAARQCGAYEGLIERFPVRIDRMTARLHQHVRDHLPTEMQKLRENAAHLVQERITRVAFSSGQAARDTIRLDLVMAAALRVR